MFDSLGSMLTWWLICAIVGGAIGMAKGRVGSGIVWGFLLGPLGIIVVLCLPDLKKKADDQERQRQLDVQLQLQRAQLDQLQQLRQQNSSPPTGAERDDQVMNWLTTRQQNSSLRASAEPNYRIACNGEEIGEMPVSRIKLLLTVNKLSARDHYFDPETQEWLELQSLSEVTGAMATAPADAKEQEGIDDDADQKAKALFARARQHVKSGERQIAITVLQDLIRRFPRTHAADQARRSLEKSGAPLTR